MRHPTTATMRDATIDDHKKAMRAAFLKLRRSLGERDVDFCDWLNSVTPHWTWNWKHQRYLYSALQRVTDGVTKRLMIFMPPRHSKTETVTVRYSAYRLERNPALRIILGCYNQKIANKFSRKTRRICAHRIRLAADRKAVEEWETSVGGGFRAVGVGAGITGFGGDLIMIDDPIKSREEAESETYRERVWEWFNDDLYTRLEPDAAIILTQTRWHDDDLAGRLLKEMQAGGEQWEVVSLPAIAEQNDPLGRKPGEPLCPERYSIDDLARIRERLGAYSFAALYQQRPIPAEGAVFHRDWFANAVVENAPDGLRWARGYDLAISTKTSADYTASFRCAFDRDGILYIADGLRKRMEYPEQRRYVIQRMVNEKNTVHGIEKALHGEALVQDLRRVPAVRHIPFRSVRVESDKYTRALAWANLAEEGKIRLVRGPWIEAFIDEACRFTGKGDAHDDQVDAVSIAVKMLSSNKRSLFVF